MLYLCIVTPENAPPNTDKILSRMAVEASALPNGGNGYVLSEEKDRTRRIYKRWVSAPDYKEVRTQFFEILSDQASSIEETKLPDPAVAAVPEKPEPQIQGLPGAASTIVNAAWRLRAVDIPISKLAQLGTQDTAGVTAYLKEFNARFPTAQRDLDTIISKVELRTPLNCGSPATRCVRCRNAARILNSDC